MSSPYRMTVCDVKQVPPQPHCFHEHGRQATTAGDHGVMIKTERCCDCGAYQILHFRLEANTEHGPYANAVWVLDSLPSPDDVDSR